MAPTLLSSRPRARARRTPGRIAVAVTAGCLAVVTACTVEADRSDDDAASPAPPAGAGPDPSAGEETTTPAEEAPTPGAAAVVTAHPLATRAAIGVLDDGGTAADAAVAAAAVLSVVEPFYSHVLGGETSALYWDAESGTLESLEAVGPVGSDFERQSYLARGESGFGLYQSIVPAAWDGWMLLLEEQGRLGLGRILAPAIRAARGHSATALLAEQVGIALNNGGMNDAARAVFAPGGRAVQAGERVVQADLARTFEQLVAAYRGADGRDAGLEAARDLAYEGDLAERMLRALSSDGSPITAEDLASYEAEMVEPITLDWGDGVQIHQNPPPSQGITMLMALSVLRDAGVEGPTDPDTVHTVVEALKLVMNDRNAYVGDPDFSDIPVQRLLSPGYAERQRARIDPGSARSGPLEGSLPGAENTTTFQIVDAEGDAVTATTSIGLQLITAGDTGITMNNRMRFMEATQESSPNYIEPGKQVRYTGNPYVVTRDDRLWFLGGVIGADTQAQVQTQHVLWRLVSGLGPREAVNAPRVVTQSHRNSIAPHAVSNQTRVETSMPGGVVDSLRSRGHSLDLTSGAGPFGYGSMIQVSPDGRRVVVATEPRSPTSTAATRPAE